MNWEEEKGLGAQNQGVLDPIKTRLKNDRQGVDLTMKKPLKVTHFKSGEVPKNLKWSHKRRKGIKTGPARIRLTKPQKKLLAEEQRSYDEQLRSLVFH
jgi:hypothetical protein